jgi:hypothetical protein
VVSVQAADTLGGLGAFDALGRLLPLLVVSLPQNLILQIVDCAVRMCRFVISGAVFGFMTSTGISTRHVLPPSGR